MIHTIALTMINGIGPVLARQLLEAFGSAEEVFRESERALATVPGIGATLAAEIKKPDVFRKAERELAFVEKNRITCLSASDKAYPARLRACPGSPILLYFTGKADLNPRHAIAIVGTRRATDYGRRLVANLLEGIAERFPGTLVVSGLAYGIDISAHRNALANRLPTVGVLAHGLDRIYPPAHRATAVEMLSEGGLLTDFPSSTEPERANFLRRNRLIAGLAEATVVVESAESGGSLATAAWAKHYGRPVLAFPGSVFAPSSAGCHALIRRSKAQLITSAADLIETLRWEPPSQPGGADSRQQTLFFDPTPDQARVLEALRDGEMSINLLASRLSMPVHQLGNLLFELEMENVVKSMPGNVFKRL